MDLKSDDLFNIDALLLSYELDKLNLDSIPNDIFELPDEISKNDDDDDSETENDILPRDNKITETDYSKHSESCAAETSTVVDKACNIEVKVEVPSRSSKRKKDINGNEEPSSEESLNELFVKLELSDSDNEEADDEDSLKLRERGPQRSIRRANRNKERNILSRSESYDRSQFSSERLKFLSGSSQIQLNETTALNQFISHNSATSAFNGNEPGYTSSIRDSFYEDARAKSVASPESGYDSSSQSIAGSPPPPISSSLNLDFIPESVDEQNILDFLAENSDGALIDNNLSAVSTDEKDDKGKITEIINFLKDTPEELCKSSNATAPSDNNTLNHVPLVSHFEDSNTSSVRLSPVSYNSVPKSVEAQKKLVCKKLDNRAKNALREFLSKEEFYAVKERIYKKINEDKANKKEIKVIYVEDETDKASENRTNLHYAVLNSKIEDIYCLVEIHKQYFKPFTDINIRDKHGKTALDYAIQNQMTLVVDYLKENTACQSVSV